MTEDEARSALATDVSRETFEALEAYVALVKKWQKAINLISSPSVAHIWVRHILDSVQVFDAAPVTRGKWLDIGSGAGFPGMVCAILAREKAPEMRFAFIESDLRKATFLREVVRTVGLTPEIRTCRVEDAASEAADIISARALAPLSALLGLAAPHLAEGGVCLFPKGAKYLEEVDAARKEWHMSLEALPSRTHPDGVILRIGDLSRG